MAKIGLVLEGGGMRGLYTAGVLDLFLEKELVVDYVIGVSAGACNGVSYVSGQYERSKRVNINYINDGEYVSFKNFLKKGSMFNMDFLFDKIPSELEPFDYEAFANSPIEMIIGVTNIDTGLPVYFGKDKTKNDSTVARASSAIPIFSNIVNYEGGKYLDGGTIDPIPFQKAFRDGCDKCIVVTTQQRGYMKKPYGKAVQAIIRRYFKKYPNMADTVINRWKIYNVQVEKISKLELEGKALIITPVNPLEVDRFERKESKLEALYFQGKKDAADMYDKILEFMK